jgi:hypothetical protein
VKKLPWTVWEAEKDGVQMLVITKGHSEEKGISNPSIGFKHMQLRKAEKNIRWDAFKFRYSIPYSSNSKAIQSMLKKDYNAWFRPRKYKGGDDCWYSDQWVEELRECAEAVDGAIPTFNSEES